SHQGMMLRFQALTMTSTSWSSRSPSTTSTSIAVYIWLLLVPAGALADADPDIATGLPGHSDGIVPFVARVSGDGRAFADKVGDMRVTNVRARNIRAANHTDQHRAR